VLHGIGALVTYTFTVHVMLKSDESDTSETYEPIANWKDFTSFLPSPT